MENSDSTITSLPRQERGACGHKGCERRRTCHGLEVRARYKAARKKGLPTWKASGRTIQGHINMLKKHSEIKSTPEHKEKERIWQHASRKRNEEKYGGNPYHNTVARGRWILAREGGITE